MAAAFLLPFKVRHVYFYKWNKSSVDQCEIEDGGGISTSAYGAPCIFQ